MYRFILISLLVSAASAGRDYDEKNYAEDYDLLFNQSGGGIEYPEEIISRMEAFQKSSQTPESDQKTSDVLEIADLGQNKNIEHCTEDYMKKLNRYFSKYSTVNVGRYLDEITHTMFLVCDPIIQGEIVEQLGEIYNQPDYDTLDRLDKGVTPSLKSPEFIPHHENELCQNLALKLDDWVDENMSRISSWASMSHSRASKFLKRLDYCHIYILDDLEEPEII